MQLCKGSLPPNMPDGVLQILVDAEAGGLPGNGLPLYNYTSKEAFVRGMPRIDQWVLPPEGH